MIIEFFKFKKSKPEIKINIGDKILVKDHKTLLFNQELTNLGYDAPGKFTFIFEDYAICDVKHICDKKELCDYYIENVFPGLKTKITKDKIIKKLNEEEYKDEVRKMDNIILNWIDDVNTAIQANKFNI